MYMHDFSIKFKNLKNIYIILYTHAHTYASTYAFIADEHAFMYINIYYTYTRKIACCSYFSLSLF